MSNSRVYLDNAATSFPKPPTVMEAMCHYASEIGASPGRGAYRESLEGAAILHRARRTLCELFGADSPDHLVFTLNCTDGLNLAIHGIVRAASSQTTSKPVHVVTTAMDHNSVLRPLNALASKGIVEWTCVPADTQGLVDPQAVLDAITEDTALVSVCHASNVTGSVQDIPSIGQALKASKHSRFGKPMFLVDAAQSLGHLPVDVEAMGIDVLAFPGHKGLMGPLGTGGLWIRPGCVGRIEPVRQGGTGSKSEQDVQPLSMPDRYESGSHNTLGIAGLLAGVEWILGRGIESIRLHEVALIETMMEHFPSQQAGFDILGPKRVDQRVGVFSIVHQSLSPAEIAAGLEAAGGVLGRAGLHCAPRAHASIGSFESGGTLRLSVGPFISKDDIMRVCSTLTMMKNTHLVER